MTFVIKHRGATSQPIVCIYHCPEHGEIDVEVQRDDNGDSPDCISCPVEVIVPMDAFAPSGGRRACGNPATWTPSASVACRVRRFEVAQGKWERPERPTYLDTRELGEGQSLEDFRAKRKAIWEEKRKRDVMEMARE